ncbi:MAG: hypothetical protein M3Y08_15755 [Fibrobacterota bacterium]|nr:hypothetical protein [Fibrobacterota bacterium]
MNVVAGNGKSYPRLLLLEMNEIPWRVIDHYKGNPEYPNIGRFFSRADTYTTIATDEGELSPWVTWPTFHRGMGNLDHKVKNLGQDPSTFNGVPIWEEYLTRGRSIGVFGSMQSWPPKNPGPGGFYVPDTFAHDEKCFPEFIESFQKFNLGQVRKSGRVVAKSSFPVAEVRALLFNLPQFGFKAKTLLEMATQLVSERWNANRRARRPIFQTTLSWDIFSKLFTGHRPDFATFFSNHVAGVMHRYWHHLFPEDFGGKYPNRPGVHKDTMDFAMKVTDRIIGEAISWTDVDPGLILVLATSMGQAAINRDGHEGIEASIPDLDKLMAWCGAAPDQYKPLLAMVPQVAVEIPSASLRTRVKAQLAAARNIAGTPLFLSEEIGDSLSVTIMTPPRGDALSGFFTPNEVSQERIPWEAAGIRMLETEPGTAYHIPEGVMAVYRSGKWGRDVRMAMSATEAKAFLLSLSELDISVSLDKETSKA